MEVTLTDDQEFFGDTTRRFLADKCPTDTVRELADHDQGYETAYWTAGAELGWTSLLIDEAHGGGSVSGSGVVDLTIVADAFGRAAAPGPLLPINVAAATICRAGTDVQRDEHLGPILAGQRVATWCGADAALGAPSLRASSDGASFVISGTATPVEAANAADLLLVSAATENGPTQFLVSPRAPGVRREALSSIDLTRRYARVTFDDVRVGPDALLGESGGAASDLERQLQLAAVVQTAEMVGAAQVTFDMTVEWAFDRYSFGRPLASYQELKHRFADMKTWLEASHGLAAALAREVQDRSPGAAETASAAQAYLGEHLGELMQDCVQMHGGIGLTADHDLHLYLRRVAADRATFGTPSDHRRRIAALAGEEAA